MAKYEFIDKIIQKYGSWSGDNMEPVCKNCAKELQRAGFGKSDVQEYFAKDGIYNEETGEGTWDKDFVDCIIGSLPINSSRQIKSARYVATDPETGEVLGSADTYEEAVNEWGEDVTITDSEAAEGQEETEGGLFSSIDELNNKHITEGMRVTWGKNSKGKVIMWDGNDVLVQGITGTGDDYFIVGYDFELTGNAKEPHLAWMYGDYDVGDDKEQAIQYFENRRKDILNSRKSIKSSYEFEIHDMDGYAEYPMTMTDAWDHVFDVSDIDTPYPSYDAWKEDVLEAIDDDEFVNDEYLGELYDYQNDLCNKYYGHDLIANSYDGNASFEKHRQSGKSFLAYVVSKVGSGEFFEEQAVSTIMRKNNCNSAYARKIFENAMNDGTLVKSGIMEIADEINKEFNTDGDLSSWFKNYVPKDGKSNTVGGELVRAANQIIDRYYNDGDKIGFGIGKETCNPAARYIIDVATDFDMNDEIERMLNGDNYPEDYDVWVDDFKSRFTDYLRDREELFHSVNKDDMWDYKQEDDENTSVDECYVVDGYGNEYWFDRTGDDWMCAAVNFAETPEFEVGDVVSEERVAEYVDFDEDDDFIDFANDSFSYSAERTSDDDWEITNVELENGLANESDYWTIDDFERDTVYDANGREISTRDLM